MKVSLRMLLLAALLSFLPWCGFTLSASATVVYYNNPNKWSKVYCYVYSEQTNNAAWHGQAMTYDATISHDGVTGWWKYEVPSNLASGQLIVNDGGSNQYPGQNQPGVQLSGKKYAWLNGTTLTETDDNGSSMGGNTGGNTGGNGFNIYVKASAAPYIYVWYDDNGTTKEPNGEWKNTKAMTATSASGWYVYNVPAGVGSVNFILTTTAGANDSQKLTGNVTNVTSDVYYAVNGSSASVTTERPDIVSEDVYVYFLNKNNYEKVYCYLFKGTTAYTAWPGSEMTLDNNIEHDGTTGWYTLKVPDEFKSASFVINNGLDGTALNGETVYDGSTATGISGINISKQDAEGWYTLSGMRVSKPTKAGVYIHNGKKIVIVK